MGGTWTRAFLTVQAKQPIHKIVFRVLCMDDIKQDIVEISAQYDDMEARLDRIKADIATLERSQT